MTKPLTLILGSGADARMVRSALIDLAAIGMVDRFLWAETPAGGRGSDPVLDEVRHTRETGLSVTTEKLSRVLAADSGRGILLVVLDMAGDADHDDGNVRDWRSRLSDQLSTEIQILHLYVPRSGSRPLTQYGDLPTLVLSPEESATPADRISPVAYPAAQHTATSLASIAGLWTTSSTSPFFAEASANRITGSYGQAQLVRTFHNASDAAEAEEALYQRVFHLDDNLPHPRFDAHRRVLDVGDDAEAVSRYSDAIMLRYGGHFVEPRLPLEQKRSRQVDGWRAAGEFLKRFFLSVFGTPAQHVQELGVRGRAGMARGIQNLLYGSDSNIEVVLGNQSGRELRPLDEVEAGVENLRRDIGGKDDLNLAHQSSLAQFWQAYTDAALTLVDGGTRSVASDDVPGPNHDGTPAIVSDVRWSVGSNDDAFEGENKVLRANVGSHISETRIQPYDPYNAQVYENAIDLASRNTRNTTVHSLKDDFHTWKARNERTFAWQVGQQLSGKLEEAKSKLQAIRSDAQRHEDELANLPDDSAKQKTLTRRLRTCFAVWLMIIAALVYCCVSHYNPDRAWALIDSELFTWQRTLFLAILTSVVIIAIQLRIFARANRGIYDNMETRRVAEANIQILARDAVNAHEEVARCVASYNQFRAWSAILGRVLSHPFGDIGTTSHAGHHADSGLPDNTVVDSVELTDGQLEDYTREVRDDIFAVGWANEALDRYLTEGIEQSRSTVVSAEERYRLYGQLGTNSQLAEIAAACRDGRLTTGSDHGRALWRDSLDGVRGTSRTLGDDRGRLATVMAEIQAGATQRPFSNAALSVMGTNTDAGRVDDTLTFAEASQGEYTLSQAFTVVQYGISTDVRAFDTSAGGSTASSAAPEIPALGAEAVTPPAFGQAAGEADALVDNPFADPPADADGPGAPPSFGGFM